MTLALRLLVVTACLAVPQIASAAPGVTLFRIFLVDGNVFVSYGEFVRLENSVVFSMPVGGPPEEPRLQVATLRADLVDWPRTDRYADSARYQRYAATRGEEDYRRLTHEVAGALNRIALSTDRQQALADAERVRKTIAEWPQAHYGYRYEEVREIVSVLDQAISTFRASLGANPFEFSLVAMTAPPELEPVLPMPPPAEQLRQVLQLVSLSRSSSDRVALLQAALMLIADANPSLSTVEGTALRRRAEREIREEMAADRRYSDLSRRLMSRATRAAERADSSRIERLLVDVPREDARLGHKRPQLVESLNTSLRARLTDARRLRLLRDQWALRRPTYRRYQRSVDSSLDVLQKSTERLEAIRGLEGPDPRHLIALRTELSGGAEQLERMYTPDYLRDIHERLIGAWRFAENAATARFKAVSEADPDAAWEASSAAAGALMMIARVQRELKSLLEPPKLP